jgi:hypothetical protein
MHRSATATRTTEMTARALRRILETPREESADVMNHKVSELFWELKYAIDQALWDSKRLSDAIAALAHAGEDVQIAVDTSLVHHEVTAANSPIVPEATAGSCGLLRLNATDILYLQALKISAGTGAE